ncbi:DsbC family protein [Phytohalomonas tamaricis]|uniref:DsbC family protein n=1 Tax=Phytohalomonas tamaricis TaxID=2081032 RepID=UPI0021D46CB2|nr:DsbC family protein [Phytohalomonas tamaricis]
MTTSASVFAAEDVPAGLKDKLVVNGQKMPVKAISPTPLDDMFEVQLTSGETFYTDKNGGYLLVGDLYQNDNGRLVNLTEQAQNNDRKAAIDAIPEQDMVIFKPAGKVKATLTVFTDTTCPYCHKLHEDVPELNKRGVEVRYLAFPRAGENSKGAHQLAQVWCSANRTEAMTAAMKGKDLKAKASCDNPVNQQYELGKRLGVQGTPALVFPDGQIVPGYLPVERLMSMLGI